jgi:hypothetical protein
LNSYSQRLSGKEAKKIPRSNSGKLNLISSKLFIPHTEGDRGIPHPAATKIHPESILKKSFLRA